MSIPHIYPITCLLLFWVSFTGCKTDAQEPESFASEDTRIWLKEAYAKLDPMKITATFNTERAAIIQNQFEKEQDVEKRLNLGIELAHELLKTGNTKDAIQLFQAAITFINQNNVAIDDGSKRMIYSMIGIAFMRQGEIDNCVQQHNHQSCFIPISGDGVHVLPSGSRNAIAQYEASLKEFPDDLETIYLLNLAYMTLGEYPDKVPSQWRIDPAWFTNKIKIQPFRDIAPELGLNHFGLAGGVVMDDFTNDGWVDIVITSWSPKEDLVFYVNNGDGTFTDQTAAYGIEGHVGILNLNQTDFNNDGWLDLHLMRGAWYQEQGDLPNTLLMNTGKGSFIDVTAKAGMKKFAPTQASAWADFNLDGWLDLVIANESLAGFERGIDLYINQKDGSFTLESEKYGLTLNHFFKGCVAADVNNDHYPDIYLSSRSSGNFLFINQQGITGKAGFQEAGKSLGMNNPQKSFPCWNFDYDNDGNEDILVSAYTIEGPPAQHWMLSNQGKADPAFLPRLYHNKGNMQFEDVGFDMGLREVVFTMGCNFGDINVDGFLDFYMATGNPLYQSLVPNKMYLNMEGRRFEDVSYIGGFANVQKGHGVAFGDLDHDGDEDLYAVLGGSYDGDGFYNCLFENPNEDQNNWVSLKLTGTKANKAAIGARLTITVLEQGMERQICRTVTSGASFGGNSLVLEVGLRKAGEIREVKVQWPCRECPEQVFTGLEVNTSYELIQDKSKAVLKTYPVINFKAGQGHSKHKLP